MLRKLAAGSFLLVALLGSMTMVGCVPAPDPAIQNDTTPFLAKARPEPGSRIGAVRKPFNFVYRSDAAMLAQIRSGIGGKTILVWDKGHGTQVEYYAANGRSYLWYPGNAGVVSGRWSVEEKFENDLYGGKNSYAEVCTQYGRDTYNPVTGATGATPECTKAKSYKIYTEEFAPGDPFRLASGNVPFVLNREERGIPSLDELHERMTASR